MNASIIVIVVLGLCFTGWMTTKDNTDKSFFKRSGLYLYTDHETKLQYLSTGPGGVLIPRLGVDGKHMRSQE